MVYVGALAVLVLAWPFAALWRAYVLIVMWGWFITPAFNYAAPTIYVLTGTLMVFHLALPIQRYKEEKTDAPIETAFSNAIAYGFLYPALGLGAGWVWKWLQWGVA